MITLENYCGGEYSDLTSTSESGWKDVSLKKTGTGSTKGRVPLSIRKTSQNYVENPQHSKADDWHIEIAVPKSNNVEFQNEESEGSSVTKMLERSSADVTSPQDIGYEYVPMDDKQECSSVSNLATDNFETKFVTVSHECLEEGGLLKPIRRTQRFAAEEISSEEQMYAAKMQDRRSLDSTVTESCSQTARGCCSELANEMVCIRKQLLEIENKQSNLMDLLQVFTTGIMDSLTSIQSRVVGLEHVVDRLSQDLVHSGRYSDLASSKLLKQSQSVHSPRLSTCTPRPSVDIRTRQPSLLSVKSSDIWEENAVGSCRSVNSAKQGTDIWTNSEVKITRNPTGKVMQKSSGLRMQNVGCGQIRKANAIFASASSANVRKHGLESKNSLWKRVKGYLCEGDLDSAYVEALCSHDELVLVELLDRTGPVLESLSPKTGSDILSTLTSYLLEQRFINSIIPWVQQVVDLSTIHGPNYLVISAKARQELLSAIQEVMNMEFSNPVERRCVTQLGMKLHHIWGKCS